MRYKNEKDLYNALQKHLIPDLLSYKKSNSTYDCFSEDLNMQIELKCRRRHYDDLMIERGKWDRLLKESNSNGTRSIYLNSTPEGVWAFDLNHLERANGLVWSFKTLPVKTQWDKGQTKRKEVSYIHISMGKDITDMLL